MRIRLAPTIIFLSSGILILYVFLERVGIGGIISTIGESDLLLLSSAMSLSLLAIVLYSLTYSSVLDVYETNISSVQTLNVNIVLCFFNILLPTATVGGEVARAFVFNQRYKVKWNTTISASLIHRIFLTIPFLTSGFIGIYASIYNFDVPLWVTSILTFAVLLTLIQLYLMVGYSVKWRSTEALIDRIAGFAAKVVGRGRVEKFMSFEEELSSVTNSSFKLILNDKRHLKKILSYLMAGWLVDFLVYYIVFLSLNVIPPIGGIVLAYSIRIVLQMVPIPIPGLIGIAEPVMTIVFSSIGVSLSISASVTILMRLLAFWMPLMIGFFFTMHTMRRIGVEVGW